MTVSSISSTIAPLLQSTLNINNQLDDLQRQLGTGEKADTFAGLGSQGGMTVALNAQLAALSSFGDTMTNVGTTVSLQQSVLQQIASVGSTVQTATVQPKFAIDSSRANDGAKDSAGSTEPGSQCA